MKTGEKSMNDSPLISVIVPVYNGENHLGECIESIINQTYKNIELILIDDGSTDSSGKICDEYASKDNRIVVVHKENQGVSTARNVALNIFKGEYLCFVDSDDVFQSDKALELIYNNLKKYSTDICMFGLSRNIPAKFPAPLETLRYDETKEECVEGRHILMHKLPIGFPVGSINIYLFHRKIFDNIKFPDGYVAEDNAILHRLLYGKKVAVLNYILYGYRFNPKSQMNNTDSVLMYKSIYNAFNDRINFYKEKGEYAFAKSVSIGMFNGLRFRMQFVLKENRANEIPEHMRLPAEEIIKLIMKRKKVLLSVIVPVYQVEKYLPACLDSILSQTLDDFELILIDDGSTDSSGMICDEYASKDNRIIVIHQNNKGLSAARNAGLRIAQGEYVTMIDSDDVLLTDDYFKFLYESLIENKAQVSICTLGTIYEDEVAKKLDIKERRDFIVTNGVGVWTCPVPNNFFIGCAYGKMYEKNLFKDVEYPEGRYVEDNAIIHYLLYPCKRISILDMPIYGYRFRKESIMNSTKKELMIRDVIHAFSDRRNFFLRNNHPELAKLTDTLMYYHISIYNK